ncbi:hypothetical protein Tco_1006826, partial [Tanacetum coccineum]
EEDTEANDETNSEDSDSLVDEENNVDDVDMKDFDFHVDEGVEFMGMDDTHAPTGSQANKRPKTQGVGSASGKTTNKGKAPAASGGVPKKTGPKKKVINLG